MQAQNIHQSHILEINVISAEDLRIKGHSIKKNAIAYVRSDPCNVGSTKMNKGGGSFPVWNDKFDLKLPMHARNIIVEVFCDKILIGSATIPASDFIGDHTPSSYMHFLCYRLRDQRGMCNGVVNLSVRVK